MKIALRNGFISGEFFTPSPEEYLVNMSKNHTFVDNLFLMFFASIVDRDIIILPMHPESALVNSEFTWIFG